MKRKHKVLSLVLVGMLSPIFVVLPLRAAQKLANQPSSRAYIVRTSLCDVFIRNPGTGEVPIYQALARQQIRLLNVLPPSSIPSRASYFDRVAEFYHTTCRTKQRAYKNPSLRLNSALQLNQNSIIRRPGSLGRISLSCSSDGSNEDYIEEVLTVISEWINDNYHCN